VFGKLHVEDSAHIFMSHVMLLILSSVSKPANTNDLNENVESVETSFTSPTVVTLA